jgi:alpha-amylase/alpha-mannosidase (GH57 family)
MCDPVTITLVATAAAGATSAYGQYQQGREQNKYYQYLAGQSQLEGAAALERSLKQSGMIQDSAKETNKIKGIEKAELSSSQKAAMAASGVDLSSVSAQDLTLDTMTRAKMDEMMIRRNANLNSWQTEEEGKYAKWEGDQQARQYSYAGKQAKKAGNIQAFSTLLGTAATMGMGAYDMGLLTKKAPTTMTGKQFGSKLIMGR